MMVRILAKRGSQMRCTGVVGLQMEVWGPFLHRYIVPTWCGAGGAVGADGQAHVDVCLGLPDYYIQASIQLPTQVGSSILFRNKVAWSNSFCQPAVRRRERKSGTMPTAACMPL